MAFWSVILNADETIVVVSPDFPVRVYVLFETFTVKTAELGSGIKDQACRFISGKGWNYIRRSNQRGKGIN